MPAISQNIGVPVERAGILIAAYMIPFGIFQIVFGPLADRYGKKQIITFSIAYFLNWRGVFAVYALLSLIPIILIIKNYKNLPDTKHSDSRFFKPYLMLLSTSHSAFTYLLLLFEGMFIVGSFSCLGAYIAKTYHYNNLLIGVIMTAFGLMTVVGGRLGGKLTQKAGPRKIMSLGLALAVIADVLIHYFGQHIWGLVIGVGLLGLGFIFIHSILLARATGFAMKARGAAMSLVAFCFMGGGGLSTAIGGKIAAGYGLSVVFLVYGAALAVTLALSFVLIRGSVVPQSYQPGSEAL